MPILGLTPRTVVRGGREGRAVELRIRTRDESGWTVLAVDGEVDLSTAPTLRVRIEQLIHDGARRLVVSLEDVGFMDSSGLSALVAGYKRMQESEGELSLVCRDRSVLRVFTVTGLDRVFAIHPTVEEAIPS
ncbi:MAG TPA: STAS domain-containing protein [Actinomycetota bacterium]|nr:STAS domain-containing protein [Actinomycetota bacterium]